MKEFIVCAANKYGDLILCGARHWDMLMHKQVDILGIDNDVNALADSYGFTVGSIANNITATNCVLWSVLSKPSELDKSNRLEF